MCSVFAGACAAHAGGLTNIFDVTRDYVANGIIGETNWDGIYLNFGDIPNGNAGGSGNGATVVANANVFANLFTVRTTRGDWAGAGDDGFFLYKVVQGDFDVVVQSAPPWSPVNNQFGGLLARAWHTNLSGAPYSTTVSPGAENFVELMRGQEFNVSEVRLATNGVDFERAFTDQGGDPSFIGAGTNATRYYRIVRQDETNFMFFWKTNAVDNWVQLTNNVNYPQGVYRRADLAGVAMQVGINHAMFANVATPPNAYFTDFQLTGPNVSLVGALPAAPSAIVTTATNTGGSLTFSWTKGDAGDNSLVVLKRGAGIQINPVQGLTYNANSNFSTANTLMGAGQYVVYNGSGNSVTVTNLGANNVTYTVAVFEYTNGISGPVYNTAAPTTNAFSGPGEITGAFVSVPQNNIPVLGAVSIRLIASFSTGETSDQTPSTTWGSGDPTIAAVDAAGAVTGVTNGTATITATFGPFVINTNITVHTPVLFDDFSATNNYLTNGIQGSAYDGVFKNFGDVPGAVPGADGNGVTTVMDSQITSTNGLTINSSQSDWQGTANDGPFLFRIVPGSQNAVSGDFQAMVRINNMNTLANASVGLMARLYVPTTGAASPGGSENHVNYWKVQNGTTAIRRTQAGGNTTFVAAGPAAGNGYLLLQRVGTNFYFFERATDTANWTFVTNIVLSFATNNVPMEVGIAQETRSGVTAVSTLRSFMLDASGISSLTPPPPPATNLTITLQPNLSMKLDWVAADSLGNPVQSIVVMRATGPVTVQPILGQPLVANSVFGTAAAGLGSGNYVVFVSAASPASTNNTVTVTGLAPGVTYYAAVYTFVGSGSSKVFNNVLPASGATASLTDGFLTGVQGSLVSGIPLGGIARLLVLAIYDNTVAVDVSALASVSSGNTNIIKISGNILTAITNGVVPITNVFSGFTNVASVTVRNPVFVDTFTNAYDYIASGVAGTPYDGLYNVSAGGGNLIPGSTYVPLAGSGTTIADANITSNNVLTITGAGDGWENAAVGGFFLFKYVAGDFQASVHINSYDTTAFNQPGILARGYGSSNGIIGYPMGYVQTNAAGNFTVGEYWVDLTRFDEFGIGTYARRNIDGVVSQNTQPDPNDGNFWLLVSRTQGTNFAFYKRLNPTDPWRAVPNGTTYQLSQFAGRPMQVGLSSGPFTGAGGVTRTVRFENYMLDYTTGSPISIVSDGVTATISWPAIPNAQLQSTTDLKPPSTWSTVSGSPTLDSTGFHLTVPATNAATFYRLFQP